MTDTPSSAGTGFAWGRALLPLVLLSGLLGLIYWNGPADALRGEDFPPVEELAFQRVVLGPDGIVATVLNDGPDTVTIAQVQVDDAYWSFTSEPAATLGHLGQTRLTIPYPWVSGDAHVVRLVTSTGVTFDHEVAVAVEAPRPGVRFFAVFALIGIYVGVIPVAIGLLWLPMVGRMKKRGLDFILALTTGLLLFLLIEAGHDGLEAAALAPGSFQAVALFLTVTGASFLGLEMVGAWLRTRQGVPDAGRHGWVLALLIATGIGLHNFGEGLAIGAAFALGEAALGTVLIVGFTLHNTTEGLAIVAPLARTRVRLGQLVRLGILGGAPTILGAWIGGLVYSPIWSVVCLALGAGAIAQVIVQLVRQTAGDQPLGRHLATTPVASGLLVGVAVMYVTGLIVG